MDAIFPFGFPWQTAFYLVFYVFTLVIHVVFMNYVLAGTGYVAFARIFGGSKSGGPGTMTSMLTEWLPAALGVAITAGVAPLLFVQILYKQGFYTANLLLFHRWMIILPVLIVAFYLLYLWRSRMVADRPGILRVLIGVVAFACFAFVAYSWTENHVLSRQTEEVWASFYASNEIMYRHPEMVPRLSVWFVGALPTMVLLVSWQLWYVGRRGDVTVPENQPRRAALLGLAGLVAAAGCGYYFHSQANEVTREQFTGSLAGVYLYAATAGLLLQLAGWGWQLARKSYHLSALVLVSVGAVLTLAGMTVVREAIRLGTLHADGRLEALFEQHRVATQVGGLPVFLAFFVICGVVIGVCIVKVRRSLRGHMAPV